VHPGDRAVGAVTLESSVTLRMTSAVRALVDHAADACDRTATEFVMRALREKLAPRCPACNRGDESILGKSGGVVADVVEAHAARLAHTLVELVGVERATKLLRRCT
jgi:hypothetical protein